MNALKTLTKCKGCYHGEICRQFWMSEESLLLTATTGAVIVRAVNGRGARGARQEIGKGGTADSLGARNPEK